MVSAACPNCHILLVQASSASFSNLWTGVDYAKMARAAKPLIELMDRTDRVRIVGPGTDLRFSKKGIPTKPCTGDRNIPDGECFSCPVRDSVEGTIQYNCETLYRGTVFNNIRLTFKNGRINEEQMASIKRRLGPLGESVTKVVVTHHPFDLPDETGDVDLVGRARDAMEVF